MFQGVAVSSGSAATGAMRPADASPHFSRGGAGRRYFSGDFGSVQYGRGFPLRGMRPEVRTDFRGGSPVSRKVCRRSSRGGACQAGEPRARENFAAAKRHSSADGQAEAKAIFIRRALT